MTRRLPAEKEPELPDPAEDLSADDDLLSWILVDQLGSLPNSRLGVHPQQVKFVGPTFKAEEVLKIVRETVVQNNLQQAMQQLQEFHLIQAHLAAKQTDSQRDRCIQHLRRYLLMLLPSSRLEIHTTSRYSHITGHPELAVFATRPLTAGAVVQELQGSVVPLPEKWRLEMDIGDDFAVRAAEEETDLEDDVGDDDEHECEDAIPIPVSRREKGKEREDPRPAGARRSDRTRRRDFSIVWSGLKRCYQLFLGPARFLNHDCLPNVDLLRQGKYVTFRVLRPVKIGEELTTFYGEDYFGKDNKECLCLTCEQNCRGGFVSKEDLSRSRSRATSASATSLASMTPKKATIPRPSSLRNVIKERSAFEDEEPHNEPDESVATRSEINDTPSKLRPRWPSNSKSADSECGSESETPEPIIRERSQRKAAKKVQPWAYLKGSKKNSVPVVERQHFMEQDDDEYPEGFPRCATCVRPLNERVWFNNHYFEHCARCTRHALIFELPWPAHRHQDVLPYPPPHLIPNGYIPPKVTTIPLPTLDKTAKKKIVEEPVSLPADTRDQKRARLMLARFEVEDFIVDQLREQAWALQVAKEESAHAKEAARLEAQRKRIDEKRRRDENRIKGSGVWSRYEYLSDDEVRKREAEKHAVLTGTRRGGKFRATEDEEKMVELAKLKVRKRKETAGTTEHDEAEGIGGDKDQFEDAHNERHTRHASSGDKRNSGAADQESDEESLPRIDEEEQRRGSSGRASYSDNTTARLASPPRPGIRKLVSAAVPLPSRAPAQIQSSGSNAKQAHLSESQPSSTISTTSTIDNQPKRRGRPPGTGKLQRAAAARSTEISVLQPDRKGKGRALPLHVMTSGIEIPDDIGSPISSDSPIYLGETASAVATELRPSPYAKRNTVFPVLGGILLPPSERPGLPSVDSASRAASGADESPKSTSEGGGVELALGGEGNPIVFDDESVAGELGMREEEETERSKKRPRASDGDVEDGNAKKRRTFFATDYPTHIVGRRGRPKVSLPL